MDKETDITTDLIAEQEQDDDEWTQDTDDGISDNDDGDDETEQLSHQQLFDEHTIQSLPVTVSCEVARWHSTVGEVRRLATGMIIPLPQHPTPSDKTVLLLRNHDHIIATVQLVRLEHDELAIKIIDVPAPQAKSS